VSKIDLSFRFPDLGARFKRHQRDILLVLAASMQTNRAMMFDKDGADNGKAKWAPPKLREGRPLQLSGYLRKSFAPQNDGIVPGRSDKTIVKTAGTRAIIGTSIKYAHVLNDGTAKLPGGVIKAKKASALKIPIAGGKFMFRKSVKIEARRMNEVTDQDAAEWSDTLANYISEILAMED
jgi:phage gpG-like protein